MKKKKYKLLKTALYVLIFVYLIIFVSANTGYYEYNNHKKVALTEQKIREFEEDIKNGKNIDINNYLVKEDYSYDNKLSLAAIKVSDGISSVVSSGVKYSFKWISKLLDE